MLSLYVFVNVKIPVIRQTPYWQKGSLETIYKSVVGLRGSYGSSRHEELPSQRCSRLTL